MNQIDLPPEGGAARALYAAIPRIRRARGWRLYTDGARRLVDLWQCGGGALFGHKTPSAVRELKSAADRGLFAGYPSHYEDRLLRALARLFPAKAFRLYASRAEAQAAAGLAGLAGPLPLWRPFSPAAREIEKSAAFLGALPFPAAPAALVLERAFAGRFPPPPPLPPFILAAASRAVCTLLASPERGAARWPEITRAVTASGLWRLEGIYLWRDWKEAQAQADKEKKHAEAFLRFLEAGFLIPPESESPLILPGELSPGEARALAALFHER